jgi:DNA-binding MarR family transcriptional regulator
MSHDELTEKIIDQFWETIPSAWHRTRAHIRRVASAKLHLTVEQFQVLRRIRRGVASVSAIAADSSTSRSAVSKAVEVLVLRKMVARHQDASDRRNIPLSLTPEGEDALDTVYTETKNWLAQRFARLNVGELDSMLRSMIDLEKIFSEP